MVYFPISPKQCFCTTLQNRKTKITHTLNFYQVCDGVITVAVLKMGVAGFSSLNLRSKSMPSITEMFFYRSKMLSAIRHVVGDNFVFQQDSAPAHRARDTIELLQREKPDFISPELQPQQSRHEPC